MARSSGLAILTMKAKPRAYDRKAVELFGEYAWLNSPKEWPPDRRREVHAQWLHAGAEGERKKVRRSESTKGGGARKPLPARRKTRSNSRKKRRD
jgi:hypothetical protein